ncbi:MAG: FecR domain-containing protein [Cyclobacteriaceae bacterium]
MDRESLIKKWLRDELSQEEQDQFMQSDDFQLLSKIDRSLENFKAPPYNAQTDIIDNLPKNNLYTLRNRRKKLRFAGVAVAMVVFALAAIFWIMQPVVDQVVISSADQSSAYLPDSSFVALNAATVLTYTEEDWPEKRSLNLNGEAFFKVKKGSDFLVNTSLGEVSVLGTNFSVAVLSNYFEVTCYEGKVAVNSRDRKVLLTAGKSFRSINGTTTTPELIENDQTSPTWLHGETSYKSLPARIVIDLFEKQYDVEINTKKIDTDIIISGSFVHDDLDIAIRGIAIPLDSKIKIANGKITLYK